ncbi:MULTISPECIES: LppX_LprAFG lipoprotein [unclassified Nocardioides]|uniref:LppX_LprAFG lipoprotein n=1 Tax=unclassified Nocardioides TaxID=2615069 RepID=UPI000700B01C|nr:MULTISPECIES: LppX_LprAFG lipoprotein [unclassified Nocardioides]KQY64074.1 hypothetical protein ASD30_03655 [Nocardioides sp. Root140]KRF16080.1 hypothetical protein ASH02_05625 [Nocardioides sp. Soil796]
MLTKRHALTSIVLAAALALTGCAGDDKDDPISKGNKPDEALALAKKTLDETSGVKLALTSKGLPDGVSGLKDGEGIGVHPAGFDGKFTASRSGLTVPVDVVALDGKVWMDILGAGFSEVDPADYGAPDPAVLMAEEGGVSDLLVETGDLEQGDDVRGGDDNSEVLTEYTGTLEGDQVTRIIPSAEGTFDVTYQINSDGELRQVDITGQFYPDVDSMSYTIKLTDYGKYDESDVKAP